MPNKKKYVLISGASIAGLTVGYWLHQYGYQVTIVEIYDSPRKGGSPVDIKGDAVDVIREMGIHEDVVRRRVTTKEVCFVSAENKIQARMDPSIMDDKIDEDIEIQREYLVDTLYQLVQNHINFIFGDTITKIEDHSNHVSVQFKKSPTEEFEFVVGADGLHSNVRKLTFGKESSFLKYHGMYAGVVDIEPEKDRADRCTLYNTSSRMAGIYNFNEKANAILVFHAKEQMAYDYKSLGQQKELLNQAFKNSNWKVPQILQKFNDADSFYFDAVSQIKMKQWFKKRVVLVGDSAYCASFLTGRGASLAILGAYHLAQSVIGFDEVTSEAFKEYQKRFKPIANKAQSSIKAGALFLVPKTRFHIWFRNTVIKILVPIKMYQLRIFNRRH